MTYSIASALFTEHENWFFLAFGLVCMVGGVKGIVTRKGVARSKGGHERRYSGNEAVVQGVISLLIGLAAVAFAIANLL